MGILSKLRDRKTCDNRKAEVKNEEKVIEKKRKAKAFKDVDVANSLAMYIVATEILMAELIEGNHPFIRIYDQFRREWKLEDLIGQVKSYDAIFKTVYKEVRKWLDQPKS